VADLFRYLQRHDLPLPGHYGAATNGVIIAISEPLAIVSLAAAAGQSSDIATQLGDACGLAVPTLPRCESAGGVSVVCAAPGRWLVLSSEVGLDERLESEFGCEVTTTVLAD
jgi:sarcosine oxidase gamma subunit